ncbi:unnamed protein product, partial [Ectocarpus sp. 13 AM-2016]
PDTTASQLAHSFRCGLDRRLSVCLAAARLGRLDLLNCARAHGCPWDVVVADEIALRGFAEMLRWARSVEVDPCPWNAGTCDLAAEGGHMPLVRWMRSKDCPCSPRTSAGIAR